MTSSQETSAYTADEIARARGEWVNGSRLGVDLKPHSKIFQPRYAAYSVAHGKTPDEMLAHDAEQFPGGKMTGYVLWISAQWRAWRRANGHKPDSILTDADHRSFDAFITTVRA